MIVSSLYRMPYRRTVLRMRSSPCGLLFRHLVLAGVAAIGLLALPASTTAAPPGRNGAVAFWLKEIDDLLGEYLEGVHVGVVTPGHRRVHFIADGLEPAFSPDGRTLAMSDGPRAD